MCARTFIAVGVIGLLSLAGCGNDAKQSSTARPSSHAAPSPTLTVRVEQSGERFASRGDIPITHDDVDGFIQSTIPAEDQAGFLRSPERIARMIDNLVARYGIAARALDAGGLDTGHTEAKILHSAVNILFEEFVDRHVEDNLLDNYEDQAKEAYLVDPDRFRPPDTVSFRHLLIIPARNGGELPSMQLMIDLHERIEHDPSVFPAVIEEHSDDPLLEENGGRYAQIEPEELESALTAVLEGMTEGQISDPVRTRHGWHIVQLQQWHQAETPEYEDVRGQYIDMVRAEHRADIHSDLVATILAQPLDLPEGAVADLMQRYGADVEIANADVSASGRENTASGTD